MGIGTSFRLGMRSSSRVDVRLGSRMALSSRVDNRSGLYMGPISSPKMGTKPSNHAVDGNIDNAKSFTDDSDFP